MEAKSFSSSFLQLLIIMQMTSLVTTVCLCSGKVLISVQRLWQYSTGREMEGEMEMKMEGSRGRGGGGVLNGLAWLSLALTRLFVCFICLLDKNSIGASSARG